jgi:hypothetical protein
MKDENTEVLKKQHPLVLIIINVVTKRLETILTNIVTALVVIYFEQGHVHKQIWQETGQHFQDLVQTNNLIEKQINK